MTALVPSPWLPPLGGAKFGVSQKRVFCSSSILLPSQCSGQSMSVLGGYYLICPILESMFFLASGTSILSNHGESGTGTWVSEYLDWVMGWFAFLCVKTLSLFFFPAATGDMPTYQIRTPTTALPQGVVMAASQGTLHSPQQLAEEATRKRELRLMKNRYQYFRKCHG